MVDNCRGAVGDEVQNRDAGQNFMVSLCAWRCAERNPRDYLASFLWVYSRSYDNVLRFRSECHIRYKILDFFHNVKMDVSPGSKPKQVREPPPSLFLGPPSQNASHVSLAQPPLANNAGSLNPSRVSLVRQRSHRVPGLLDTSIDVVAPSLPRNRQNSEVKRQVDRTNAQWAEMQSTLEEVELSAVNGNHVFGPQHSKALEALRVAQIGLAKAWARSEADEVVENADKDSKAFSTARGTEGRSPLDTVGTDGRASTARGSTAGSGVPGVERFGSSIKEETETDILLARKRREANDRYFERVNGGVLDVVAKLEEVANAMKAVEQESRDIWGETESDGRSIRT